MADKMNLERRYKAAAKGIPGNVKGKSLKALIVSGGGPMREAQYAIVDEPSRSEPNGQSNESI